ncbi:MAG TPA: hypothetical protein VJX67_20815 [Blastocatellia bacterium]|nr:hypothetical protein [Blastocatellia bacterium]
MSKTGEGLFSRFDKSLDRFLARCAERYFRGAPSDALQPGIGKSWKLLGEGFVASALDLLVLSLLFYLLPFRFILLLISTPIRLIAHMGSRQKKGDIELPAPPSPPALPEAPSEAWLQIGVTERTTETLAAKRPSHPSQVDWESRGDDR